MIKSSHLNTNTSATHDDHILTMIQNDSERDKGFKILMDKYQSSMYQHIRRIVVHHEEAADVLQNVWIKILRAIPSFKGESSLYTWMYRICTNESLTHLRKQNRRKTQSIEDADDGLRKQAAGTDIDGDEIKAKLRQAILLLLEKQKLVFSLRYFEDMNYSDMSEVLGTSVGGLKASYHHAVKKIEAYIKQQNA